MYEKKVPLQIQEKKRFWTRKKKKNVEFTLCFPNISFEKKRRKKRRIFRSRKRRKKCRKKIWSGVPESLFFSV